MSLADHADTNDGRGIIHALECIEVQLRVANLIAFQRFQEAQDLLEAQNVKDTLDEAIRVASQELDGTERSAVRLLTGATDAELDDLGGFATHSSEREP